MNTSEAKRIVDDFNRKCGNFTEDEAFVYTEALDYLIETTKSPKWMTMLGGYYYDLRHFDLARKYYEMAEEYEYLPACLCIGYIWYYGRTGEKNYEKAFYYFSKCEKFSDVAAYKLSDMYRNGYGTEKNLEKSKEIIERLYEQYKYSNMIDDPVPEIYTRLAKIRTAENRTDEAVELYLHAKSFLGARIGYSHFFGDRTIMKWLIKDLYSLIPFDYSDFDLYDLYYLLQKPVKVNFRYKGKIYTVEAVMDDGECVISFNGKWFRTIDDFFEKAKLDDYYLTIYASRLTCFEVVS